jgi:hypothetical protein
MVLRSVRRGRRGSERVNAGEREDAAGILLEDK